MFQKLIPLAGLCFLTLALQPAQAQHGDPFEPVGDLTVTPTVVQTGVAPRMFWDIEYPEHIDDLVTIGGNSQVTTNKDLRVKVRMVGVAFQSGNTLLPAALWIRINGGSWQLLFYGRESDVNPAQFVFNQEVPAGTRIDFAARGKNSSGNWYSTRWTASHMEEVIALRNGDPVPDYAPAYEQGRIEDFLTQYIDSDNRAVLGPRDLIYLYELASTDPGDWYYDMQDLSAVVTFDEPDNPSEDAEEANADEYYNFIRQIHPNPGGDPISWDLAVDPDGEQDAQHGVSADGALFQLWTQHNTSLANFLLDEQMVSAYEVRATVAIETGDPYQPVPRTRVDQPFIVTINVSGLDEDGVNEDGTVLPEAAQMVAFSHEAFTYPEGQHSLDGVEDPEGAIIEQSFLENNGAAANHYSVTNLQAADLTTAEGEEIFTVTSLVDYGANATVLDSKRVQIWPIARGSLSGFDPNEHYEDVPPVVVTLTDLYPASATYVRVYPGPPSSNPANAKMVTASYVLINNVVPQDPPPLRLDKIDRYFTVEGLHTVEILHETPFGTDLLDSASISVDRTVEVFGTLFTKD